MLIDSHCHLYDKTFADDRDQMMHRAIRAGVERFYLPAIDSSVTSAMLQLEVDYPGKCFGMMGLHPCSVGENYQEELQLAEGWLQRRSFAAIGETGLDFYWDKTFITQQVDAFTVQIGWAKQYRVPLVIHSRDSTPECIALVSRHQDAGLKGIFHCFGGSVEEAEAITRMGFYLGIGGIITFKNSRLGEMLKAVSLEHMVLETDAPYLAPAPFRGKRNESSYLPLVAEKLAEIKGISAAEVTRVTTANAQKLFSPSTAADQA